MKYLSTSFVATQTLRSLVAVLAIFATSACANAYLVVRTIVDHVDYDYATPSIGTSFAQSLPYGSSTFNALFAKAHGSVTAAMPLVGGSDAHAYIKEEVLCIPGAGESTLPTIMGIDTIRVWSFNWFGNASANVSFDGLQAIGSTGNTGIIPGLFSPSSPVSHTLYVSVGAAGGGFAAFGTSSHFAQGDYSYKMY